MRGLLAFVLLVATVGMCHAFRCHHSNVTTCFAHITCPATAEGMDCEFGICTCAHYCLETKDCVTVDCSHHNHTEPAHCFDNHCRCAPSFLYHGMGGGDHGGHP